MGRVVFLSFREGQAERQAALQRKLERLIAQEGMTPEEVELDNARRRAIMASIQRRAASVPDRAYFNRNVPIVLPVGEYATRMAQEGNDKRVVRLAAINKQNQKGK